MGEFPVLGGASGSHFVPVWGTRGFVVAMVPGEAVRRDEETLLRLLLLHVVALGTSVGLPGESALVVEGCRVHFLEVVRGGRWGTV